MSKKGNPVNLSDLATAIANSKSKPKSKPAFIGPLENKYLGVAVDKLSEPLHPNFAAALKAKRKNKDEPTSNELRIDKMRHLMAKSVDAAKGDGKGTIITAVKTMAAACKVNPEAFNDGDLAYLAKEVLGAVAFHANIETGRLLREGTPFDDCAAQSIVQNDEDDHAFDALDASLFDLSQSMREKQNNAGVEQHEPETMADNAFEAGDAVEKIQAWLGCLFIPPANMPQAAREAKLASYAFWGVDGLVPMGSYKRDDGEWMPITDFDTYRIKSRDAWLKKQNSAFTSGYDPSDLLEKAA